MIVRERDNERLKACGGPCRRVLIVHKAFNRHVSRDDGYQPFCKECDSEQKAEIQKGHKRLLKQLEGNPCRRFWMDLAVYMAIFNPGVGHEQNAYGKAECYWCGGAVNQWSRGGKNNCGYWLDRRSNRLVGGHKAYTPDNCVPCCSPCNFAKSAMNSHVFAPHASLRIRQYGWGRIQWDEIDPAWHRAMPPDLSEWVRNAQTEMPI